MHANVIKMRSCFLLVCAQFAFGVAPTTNVCMLGLPNCRCTVGDAASSITVDCQTRRGGVDREHLSDQLDLLLSSNLTYGRLTSLSIVNTPLTHVPRSVCRLTTLTHLQLDNNRLVQLPDNCLTNLSNLAWFSAQDNAIELLQDGVFQGLTKLQYLNLNRNRIGSIGLSVFATSSNLNSLFDIRLHKNNLTTLEPWFYFRGLIGNFQNIVNIDLSDNKISKFTNKMGFHGFCSEPPFVHFGLQYNRIRHFIDILEGWEVNFEDVIRCYRIREGRINFLISLYGNRIACDCVDYNFFRVSALQDIEYYWQSMKCVLTDPLTGKSSLVDGFKTPLKLFVCQLTEHCPTECVCVYRPANATLHIYCSNANLTDLPRQLPELPDILTRYKLDFSHNQLRRLERREYFANTVILDVSNCGLVGVIDWEEIVKIPDVSLYGNEMTSLSPSFLSVNITTGTLNLADNPWDCSCGNKWMSGRLAFMADRLTQKVLCHSPDRLRGKNIIQVSDDEFCVDPASEAASKAVKRALIVSMSSFSGAVVVLASVGVIISRLRVKLYTRWKFHPFDRDECVGEDMEYDVFLSCSSDDNLPHGNNIRQLLEQRGYRVCYPPRDFVAGDSIYDNIYSAVVSSKRTVCFLTSHFVHRFKQFHLKLSVV